MESLLKLPLNLVLHGSPGVGCQMLLGVSGVPSTLARGNANLESLLVNVLLVGGVVDSLARRRRIMHLLARRPLRGR